MREITHLSVLNALEAHPQGLSAAGLVDATGERPSSILRAIRALLDQGRITVHTINAYSIDRAVFMIRQKLNQQELK